MHRVAVFLCCLFLLACKPATFEEGWAYQKANDYAKAIEVYKILSDGGDSRAQVELGIIYSKKEYNDPQKSFDYFKLAADQGQMWANLEIGTAYEEGTVVGKNLGYAEQRYIKAANEGLVLAMSSLVSLYTYNDILSFEKSLEQRRHWALSAFERGDAISANSMQSTYTPFGLDYNAWHNVYPKAALANGRTVANYKMYEGKTPQESIQILLKTQEIMRIFNHIEPPNPFPWRK